MRRLLGYFVVGVNGHGKPVEVRQLTERAAEITRDRLVAEGIRDVVIEPWYHESKEDRDG